MPQTLGAVQNTPAEWSFISARKYRDPFNEVELDVVVTDPAGRELRVPAFWAGGNEWRIRFAPASAGRYTWQSVCSDPANDDLHDRRGTLKVAKYHGDNPLLKHGPLRISADRTHFEHADGAPFFWLGDTWWMSLTSRLGWPREFKTLVADRKAKGFSVVQVVAGLLPDMEAFDKRAANEGGFAWEKDFAHINPAYFDHADHRIAAMVSAGLVPCIVGAWGYYLPLLGTQKMERHWRYLIARYGAHPVIWCLAGEMSMPWYLSKDSAGESQKQREGWPDVAAFVRKTDPYRHPLTVHPCGMKSSADELADLSPLDFSMVQGTHGGQVAAVASARHMNAVAAGPKLQPVVNAEVCYEGILGTALHDVQRYVFWTSILSSVAGFTYGANGIWQINRADVPYGPSPHGGNWGATPWTEAYKRQGSAQVARGKRLLERYEWWRIRPQQQWVEPAANAEDANRPYAAGIPGELRIYYFPQPITMWGQTLAKGLEKGVKYKAMWFDPAGGAETPAGEVKADAEGNWRIPQPPLMQDFVMVMERVEGGE